ncbi:MAG: hypothetical protein Q8880_07180 [Bacteroidota bacterium]|nr:hypothetical protein [Bacteroidota bacterium]
MFIIIALIIFNITLLYISIAKRLNSYINLIAFQGFLLFVIAFYELSEIHIINLIFVLLETVIFKTFAIPYFLKKIIKKNKITREAEPFVSNFISLLIITTAIFISFVLATNLEANTEKVIYYSISISTVFTGLFLIMSRKKIITHIMGYIIIENGVFLLSLAVGNKMPMLVNTGILLDIFATILTLGIFVNKIGDVFKEVDVDNLESLKD